MSGLFEGRSGQYRDGVAWSPTEWEREGQGEYTEALDMVRRTSVRFSFGGAHYPTGRPVFVEYAVTRSERIPGASDRARVVCAIAYIDGAQAEFTYLLNHVPNPPAGPVRNWASSFALPPDPPVRSIQLYVRNEGDGAFRLGEPHVRISTPTPCDDADGTVVGPAGFEPATNGL